MVINDHKKGYCCYSLTLQWYLISADVTFFESISYFEFIQVTSKPFQEVTPTHITEVINIKSTIISNQSREPDPLDITMVNPTTSWPLQAYHQCHPMSSILVPKVIADFPLTLSSSPDLVLQHESNLLIALFKNVYAKHEISLQVILI